MATQKTVEIPIAGMDCAECTMHVQKAISGVHGVDGVEVFLASEKAVVRLDPETTDMDSIRKAVAGAGYAVADEEDPETSRVDAFSRPVLAVVGLVFGVVLFVVVVGEWLGLFETLTERIPWYLWLAVILAGGYPVFRNVLRAALRREVISHTLMTAGVIAAIAVGEWATAAVVVFFMRVGNYVESFTAGRARRALKDLTALAPQTARLERDGGEVEVPVEEVLVGDIVVVRPGEKVPVDGVVVSGQATLDQAAITGESMPVEAGTGARVFAASIATLGSLRVRTTQVGKDTTFGRVIRLVEEAEAHRGEVQRFADRFSAYYLPIVAGVALLTYLLRRDPLAAAAVLVVACSCSFALATPIAVLASVGAGARKGLMFKGGKYLELLAKADVVLLDKTGTVTLGHPKVVEVWAADGAASEDRLLAFAASAERYSEHPLAQAVRTAAVERGVPLETPQEFEALPGLGVRARVNGSRVVVGRGRLLREAAAVRVGSAEHGDDASTGPSERSLSPVIVEKAATLEQQGRTVVYVHADGGGSSGEPPLTGLIALEDTIRSEVPEAVRELREMGIEKVELLTGDNTRAAQALASGLGVPYQAELLPEDKIRIVREYQAQGNTVVMIGDGVNDAPALAQADVGIAMGAAGSDIAVEAAHIALMRQDWTLVPEAFRIARRTMGVVKGNIGFTALYNTAGLTLAALGFIPPVLAAAAQSLPDIGILANSARLLRK